MNFKAIFCVLFMGMVWMGFAQITETEKLLEQAEQIVYIDPVEANHISEYNLKFSVKEGERVKSLYIQSLSFYIMGQYSKSLESAFKAKRMATDSGNDEFEEKSTRLIIRTLQALQLKTPPQLANFSSEEKEPVFRAEDFYKQAEFYRNKNNLDSVSYFMEKAKESFSTTGDHWLKIIEYNLKGDLLFKELKMSESVKNHQKALIIAQKINNSFLLQETHQKLANSYLAMDSISKFQSHTQLSQNLITESFKLENEASNSAHMLISAELDQQFAQMKSRYQVILWVILALLGLGLIMKMIFYIRNKNKLKMYRNILDYLNRQNQKLEVEKEEESDEKREIPKTVTLLKESENQILSGLEKFEAGKKFTNKDMSLGMLAAQLNTNTKYLSEVINRQKQKNFNQYINELRINYITEKIKSDPNYLNFKVSYLAEECGFSSHSTFTTVFKSIVGVSPIMFVDFIKEEIKTEKLEPAFHD